MHVAIAEAPATKPVRKRSVKPVRQEDASKVKATIHISERAMKMLGVYAVMTDSSNSGVVETLILEHLKRFVVSDRARSSDEGMSTVSVD